MKKYLLVICLFILIHNVFAQDSAINKMNQSNDRNRVTDTVHVGGTNDRMNVPVPLTTDSVNGNNLNSGADTATTAPTAAPVERTQSVWVSRGLWIALIVIVIVIVVRRRKNAGK